MTATPQCDTAQPRVFLIGYRGTGKSTVARLLAAKLHWQALDADAELEVRHGMSIQQIFATEGEPAFRDKEAAILGDLCQRHQHVIATGGGVILRPANRDLLRTHGTVVWLTADIDTICERLRGDASTASRRPALTVGGRAEVEELLRLREPLYREASHFRVDSARRAPEQVAEEVFALLRQSGAVEIL